MYKNKNIFFSKSLHLLKIFFKMSRHFFMKIHSYIECSYLIYHERIVKDYSVLPSLIKPVQRLGKLGFNTCSSHNLLPRCFELKLTNFDSVLQECNFLHWAIYPNVEAKEKKEHWSWCVRFVKGWSNSLLITPLRDVFLRTSINTEGVISVLLAWQVRINV